MDLTQDAMNTVPAHRRRGRRDGVGMKIVVVGGGLTGLLSGLLLARRGHAVTVVERDVPPPNAGPDAAFESWRRPGVPQCRQPHVFLGRSVRVLRDHAPDLLDQLLRSGSLRVPVDLGDGPDDAIICSRRLTFEAVLWDVALRQPGLRLICQTGVSDFLYTGARTPRVRGVLLEDGTGLDADLVIDASGRRSPTPRILAGHGLRPIPEMGQECGLLYLSRHYRLRPGAEYPSLAVPIMASLGWVTAIAFPGDRGTFCMLAATAAIDPLRRELATPVGFSRLHAAIPLMAPWLEAGEPITGINTMARVDNRYRRLVDGDGTIATGLLLLGDAAMHTNPTAGRGVSLAFAHVQQLILAIEKMDSLSGLALEFDAWTDANIACWYQLQAGADASMLQRAEAAVRGEELPPPDKAEQIRSVVIEMSKQPGPQALKLRRMKNLVSRPSEVLGDPAVLAAAEAFLAQRLTLDARQVGPSRRDYMDLAGLVREVSSRS